MHRALHQAVALQTAQCLGQHFLRNSADLALQRCVTHRASGQNLNDERGPFIGDPIEHAVLLVGSFFVPVVYVLYMDEIDMLRASVLADKSADLIYDRAGKVQDALAGGTTLDDLPGDLGVAAVTGTLDAQGNTADGKPALDRFGEGRLSQP